MALQCPLECVAFVLVANGRILVERRSRKKRLLPGICAIPGGHMEQGETPESALEREFGEELGIVPRSYVYVCTLLHRSEEFRRLHYFAIDAWDGKLTPHEADDLLWLALSDLAALDLDIDHVAVSEYLRVYRPTGSSSPDAML